MAQAPCNFLDAGRNHRGRVGSRHGDLGWEPGKGVSYSFTLGGPNVGTIALVAVKGGADVPAVDAMSGPGGALMRLFMDDNVDTRWSNGGTIEIKVAVDLGPGGEIGIDARALHEVESENGLWKQSAPEV
jgi:hypothetical protein